MQRVHHFPTSSDAFDASLAEGAVREGDALVIAAERIVGIASTDPIAVTVSAGSLCAFPSLPRDRLLDELVHGEATIGFAVDEAVRHGFPVAAHYNEFGSFRGRTVKHAAHVVFSLDDIAVVLDAIDRRAAALEQRVNYVDGDCSYGRDQHHLERLRAARERLAGLYPLDPVARFPWRRGMTNIIVCRPRRARIETPSRSAATPQGCSSSTWIVCSRAACSCRAAQEPGRAARCARSCRRRSISSRR